MPPRPAPADDQDEARSFPPFGTTSRPRRRLGGSVPNEYSIALTKVKPQVHSLVTQARTRNNTWLVNSAPSASEEARQRLEPQPSRARYRIEFICPLRGRAPAHEKER